MSWFLDLKVGTKLVTCFLLLSAVLVVVGFKALEDLRFTNAEMSDMYKDRLVPAVELGVVGTRLNHIRLVQHELCQTVDKPAAFREYEQKAEDDWRALDRSFDVEAASQMVGEEEAAVRQAREHIAKVKALHQQLLRVLDGAQEPEARKKAGLAFLLETSVREAAHQAEASVRRLTEIQSSIAKEQQRKADGIYQDLRRSSLWIITGATVFAVLLGLLLSRHITGPLAQLKLHAEALARGELGQALAIVDRKDEIGQMAASFRAMSSGIREVVVGLRDGVRSISSSSAQLSATAKEYTETLAQQASSVAEVSATVEEIKQTSQAAAAGARDVAQSADAAMESGQHGREAVGDSVSTMQSVGERVSGIATQILKLSEQTTQIGMIVETVNDLAEQSNLLAVNASIEAAKAGDHGRGFAVVATEVRSLAEQSKRATQQIRGILADIQKATHGAVMATEEGTKRAEEGQKAVEGVRTVIDELAAVLEQSSTRARQIAGAASQQAAGVAQISTAMDGIAKAQRESVAGVKQLEAAVVDLNRFATQLDQMAAAYRV